MKRTIFLCRDGVNFCVIASNAVAAAAALNTYMGPGRIYNYEPRDFAHTSEAPALVSGYSFDVQHDAADAHDNNSLFITKLGALV